MRRSLMAGLAALAAATVVAPAAPDAQSNRWGADYFPNLPVVTQDGKTLNFYDDVIKGKIVVVSFIYTNCPDICPLTTARISQVEAKLGGIVGRDIFLISMTVDPVRDTPARLKEFSQAFGAGPGWLFLTGSPQDIKLINNRLGDRSRMLSEHRNEIVLGKRGITADTAVRLEAAWSVSAHYWMSIQADYEIALARERGAASHVDLRRYGR